MTSPTLALEMLLTDVFTANVPTEAPIARKGVAVEANMNYNIS